jgi:deoxyribodipyrimidine photo-lyase
MTRADRGVISKWFAKKLPDFDLASNNSGWQSAAGSGGDAALYFRVLIQHYKLKNLI